MDYQLFRRIIRLAGYNPSLDKTMIFISNNARYVFAFLLIFMWFRDRSNKKVTINAINSLVFSMFIHFLFKLFYFKPRPFVNHRVGILIPSKTDTSFPSKHTLLTFAVSTSIFLQKRILGVIMWVLSGLTGFSRIWVGHHYPSDIIGSAVIGTTISFIIDRLSRFFNRN